MDFMELITGKTACQRELGVLYKQGLKAEEAYLLLKAKGYNAEDIKEACLKELDRMGYKGN